MKFFLLVIVLASFFSQSVSADYDFDHVKDYGDRERRVDGDRHGGKYGRNKIAVRRVIRMIRRNRRHCIDDTPTWKEEARCFRRGTRRIIRRLRDR